MGLAILPARLKDELEELSKCLVEGKDVRAVAELEKHADWVDEFLPRHPELNSENVMDILKEEVGKSLSAYSRMPAFTSAPRKAEVHLQNSWKRCRIN